MLAHAALALSLVVRVYDAYGVPGVNLSSARSTATQILKTSGVSMIWRQCPCNGEVASAELLVRITSAPASVDPSSLGFSYVDVNEQRGTLATIFADRVHTLAASAAADEGALLGRAIAHELAHLLLGSTNHAKSGLMREQWTSIELVRNHPIDWQFSADDRVRLRSAALRRLGGPAAEIAIARRTTADETISAP